MIKKILLLLFFANTIVINSQNFNFNKSVLNSNSLYDVSLILKQNFQKGKSNFKTDNGFLGSGYFLENKVGVIETDNDEIVRITIVGKNGTFDKLIEKLEDAYFISENLEDDLNATTIVKCDLVFIYSEVNKEKTELFITNVATYKELFE